MRSPRTARHLIRFLAALESPELTHELSRLLEGLLGSSMLEVVPEDGPIVLSTLTTTRPTLAFISTGLRRMEGLTLLRALPEALASRVVLLAPDTLEGYRAAWEGLFLGASDFMVSRGSPPQRFKGGMTQRLRQVASLLSDQERRNERSNSYPRPCAGIDRVAGRSGSLRKFAPDVPWVAAPETRNLAATTEWLRGLDREAPVALRIPDGPRFLRVAREGIGRFVNWPVRILASGDRLVPGHVHLFSEGENLRVDAPAGWPIADLAAAAAPGSWGAQLQFLERLRASSTPLRILAFGGEEPELEDLLSRHGTGPHAVHRLNPAPTDSGAALEPGASVPARKVA